MCSRTVCLTKASCCYKSKKKDVKTAQNKSEVNGPNIRVFCLFLCLSPCGVHKEIGECSQLFPVSLTSPAREDKNTLIRRKAQPPRGLVSYEKMRFLINEFARMDSSSPSSSLHRSVICPACLLYFRPRRPSIFLSISVSGRRSMIFPNAMGSLRSPGDERRGGVRDIDGSPSFPGRLPEVEEVEEPGE